MSLRNETYKRKKMFSSVKPVFDFDATHNTKAVCNVRHIERRKVTDRISAFYKLDSLEPVLIV